MSLSKTVSGWADEIRKMQGGGSSKAKALGKAKKDNWHSIGAGRVGDKYKGGTIKKMDYKNGRALIK